MHVSHHETAQAIFTKKVKAVSLVASTPAEPEVVLFQPEGAQQFMLTQAFVRVRNRDATAPGVAPQVAISDGTNNHVGPVALASHAEGFVQRLAVVGNIIVDATHPLTLEKSAIATTTLQYDVDVIVVLVKVSDVA
jgi:hypothetical protein